MFSSVACPALQNPSTLSHQSSKKKSYWTQNVGFDFLSTIFVWDHSHFKNWARYDKKCIVVFMQSTRYSCPRLIKFDFSCPFFRKILKCQISRKSFHLEPSCFMRKDGQTDITKIIVAFSNFANTPKNYLQFCAASINGLKISKTLLYKNKFCTLTEFVNTWSTTSNLKPEIPSSRQQQLCTLQSQ
jgi:hypothetical protein